MKKYKKKVISNQIEKLFESDKNILIGQFDNTRVDVWQKLKENYDFFLPKNGVCKYLLKNSLKIKVGSMDSSLNAKVKASLFEGPIFCLIVNTETNLSNVLVTLTESKIALYGGLFNAKFYDFADIKEIEKLLIKKRNSVSLPNENLYGLWNGIMFSHQKICMMNEFQTNQLQRIALKSL